MVHELKPIGGSRVSPPGARRSVPRATSVGTDLVGGPGKYCFGVDSKNKILRTNGEIDGPGLREAPYEKPGMHICKGHGPNARTSRRHAQRGYSQFTAVFCSK